MIDVDIATARELVKDLRDTLLFDEDEPSFYDDWRSVWSEIDSLYGSEILDEHLIALGACSEIDPQRGGSCCNALISFCKSVALESQKNMGKEAAS